MYWYATEHAADGFPQVNDMNEVALAVNVRPHLRVPTAGPVAEVYAGLDEVFDLNDRHAAPSAVANRRQYPDESGESYQCSRFPRSFNML